MLEKIIHLYRRQMISPGEGKGDKKEHSVRLQSGLHPEKKSVKGLSQYEYHNRKIHVIKMLYLYLIFCSLFSEDLRIYFLSYKMYSSVFVDVYLHSQSNIECY